MWGAACNNNRPFPDVPDALARMARLKLRLGIVSNTQSFDLDVLRREGLFPWIHTLCLSCDHGCLKPDPRLFLEAARQMELPPGEILMIGDQIDDDVRGARAAGMRAALLDRCPEKDRRARAVAIPSGEIAIHGLDELAGRLERNDPFIASS
jgi:putative hydrolase of the HAD superfamily